MKKSVVFATLFVVTILKSWSQTASFITSKDQDCNILKVTLDASASSGASPLTYYWDFGNGNTVAGRDKSVVDAIYVTPGQPIVSLYTVDADGVKSNVATKTLTILAGPQIDFAVDNPSTCSGKPVQFLNTTKAGSSPITGYIWNIGNTISLKSKEPSYSFESSGIYDVTLVVTDANGCNVSLKKEKLISVQNKFEANVVADQTYSCTSPLDVQFKDNTNYSAITGHTITYSWDFGDGTYSKEQHPFKTYSSLGSFPVTLIVSDNTEGCSSRRFLGNYIVVGARKPYSTIELASRLCTQFTYKISPFKEGLPHTFQKIVEPGDGTSYNLGPHAHTLHTYSKSGTYIVKTTFIDPSNPNCTQSGYDTLKVPSLGEDIIADKTTDCKLPMEVNFSTKGIPDGLYYKWDFGDGTTSEEITPKKNYNTKGTFDVNLQVWSKSGCVYNIEKKALIKAGRGDVSFSSDAKRTETVPKDFAAHPLKDSSSLWGGCVPFTVHFNNTSVNSPGRMYTWNFGDGTQEVSSSAQINHTYTTEGVYSPTLSATDSAGCTDTFVCNDCVRAGNPPKANITQIGPDTVCCFYDKTFAANVDLKDVDLLWYDIVLNDGSAAAYTQAYYKDSNDKWTLEDNTTSIYPYSPPGMGLRFAQTNFALPSGNHPDFYFYAYKNGCATKIEYPKYQVHLLPWGTFAPLPCAEEENLKAGDTLDFNKIGGNWVLGDNPRGGPMKLSKAEVQFEFISTTGCTMPVLKQTYTPASLGFELEGTPFQNIQQAGKFPKIVIPACASKGDEIVTTTYLYTADDAGKYYKDGQCLCEEHWPYKIGASTPPSYTVSAREGCAPLQVTFASSDPSYTWVFEDGVTLKGANVSRQFTTPGNYKFRIITNSCTPSHWSDSVKIHGLPSAKMGLNQKSFCLNDNPKNTSNKSLQLTDSSTVSVATDTLVSWKWILGNGQHVIKTDNSKVSYSFVEKDAPSDPSKGVFVSLTVTDNHGCEAKDSTKIILRKTTPVYTLSKTTGCYDTLRITPNYPSFGSFPLFSGSVTINQNTQPSPTTVHQSSLSEVVGKAILLNDNGDYRVKMEINSDGMGTCYSSKDTVIKVQYHSLLPNLKVLGKTRFTCIPAMVATKDATPLWNGLSLKSWEWKFTNKITKAEVKGTGPSPSFALTDSGYYSLEYTVEDQTGCKKTIRKDSVVYINELNGKIDSLPPPLCPGEIGRFAGSSKNAQNFFWDFGDGVVGSGLQVQHAYTFSGERNISFIVTDSANCRKSYSGKVVVKPSPMFNLGKDTLLCERQTLLLQGPVSASYAYHWTTGETTPNLSVKKAGTYGLSVNDIALNCPFSDTVHIAISQLPKVKILPVLPICKGEEIQLSAELDSSITTSTWRKDQTLLGSGKSISFSAQDTYPIKIEVRNKDHCANYDSIVLPLLERPVLSLTDQFVCPGDSAWMKPTVSSTNPLFHFKWYGAATGPKDTTSSLLVKSLGTYRVEYGKPNCTATASARLIHYGLPSTTTNPSTFIFCEENSPVEIDGGTAAAYLWYPNNETGRTLSAEKVGIYTLRISNEHGCFAYDTIKVENRCPPKLYVPTAFTPTEEGPNKVHTIFGYNIGSFELLVFNRWGEVIYQTNDLTKPWDGRYRNELMPSGSYPWLVKYTGNNPDYKEVQQLEGKVVLVR